MERQGDVGVALDWTRKAVALKPESEVAIRRLIGLLGRAGDNAAALRAYEEFAARLREEFDIKSSGKSMTETAPNTRLEALSDGVFAIALTLLVLDIRLPDDAAVTSTTELWVALRHLGPALFAFLLSFAIILITWVNHHAFVKLVRGTSPPFVYANGFLLLTVAVLPFPTTLLGEFLLTAYNAPAVVLYDVALATQAIAWILLISAVLRGGLAADEAATATLSLNRQHGYGAAVLYGLLAVAAFWLPLAVAVVTTVTWGFWLVKSIRWVSD